MLFLSAPAFAARADNVISVRRNNAPQIFPLAKVGNHIITNFDLTDRLQFIIAISDLKISSAAERKLLARQVLDKMIDEELQSQEAAKLKITLSDEELDAAIANIASNQGRSVDQLRVVFKKEGISYEHYRVFISGQILWNKFIKQVLVPQIKVSDAEIAEYLESRKINNSAFRLKLAEIYIPFDYKTSQGKLDAEKLIAKLRDELMIKDNFANLATQFSRSATAEFGGEIGWIEKVDIDPKIYESINALEVGKISNVLRSKDGYYIFKILDKETVSALQAEDIAKVKSHIMNNKLQVVAKAYLFDLHKNSFIEINQKNLNLWK